MYKLQLQLADLICTWHAQFKDSRECNRKISVAGLAAGLGVGALAESLRRSLGASDGKIVVFGTIYTLYVSKLNSVQSYPVRTLNG